MIKGGIFYSLAGAFRIKDWLTFMTNQAGGRK